MTKTFREFVNERMSKPDLEKRLRDLEDEMVEMENDIKKYKKSGDTDSLEMTQDTYDLYKKKHAAAKQALKTAK